MESFNLISSVEVMVYLTEEYLIGRIWSRMAGIWSWAREGKSAGVYDTCVWVDCVSLVIYLARGQYWNLYRVNIKYQNQGCCAFILFSTRTQGYSRCRPYLFRAGRYEAWCLAGSSQMPNVF